MKVYPFHVTLTHTKGNGKNSISGILSIFIERGAML